MPGTPSNGAMRSNFERLLRMSAKAAIATATAEISRTGSTPYRSPKPQAPAANTPYVIRNSIE